MNSIDREQPEKNHEDLSGAGAMERIKEMVEKAQNCFFCTEEQTAGSMGVRPMNVRKVDAAGNLWFLSASDSHKNQEIRRDPRVKLYFQGSTHSDFLYLEGAAEYSRDRAKIDELWSFTVNTWFTEGKDDPRVTVIKVTPTLGYYWDTKHGNAVAGVKMMIGAAVRKTLDDSIQGKLTV